VQQGNLETSNASAIDEMVQLIANQRAYEISSKVVETMDQSYQRLYRPN
jgi:flagellar basal-body rod protein FlgG